MVYPSFTSMAQQAQRDSTSPFDDLLDRNNRLFRTWAILGVMAAAATAAILSVL